ncbi:dynamin family protein [Shewanella sp. AC34-MNA-CIBAN-0136]|uniref:dynamin family protein n=2 Tax=Gammaproteobacteria TaxID=1236 RepID=UPI00332F31B5
MHRHNFELLQQEAIRLINIESNFLAELDNVSGLVMPQQADKQTFDQTSVKYRVEVLQGEKIKLENQELVIAVVGTMKAGKSTTINAIVGTEILPNRNRPMTALPTLIRHVVGQKEPILHLQNNQPLNAYLQALQSGLGKSKFGIENQEDMEPVIRHIESGKPFEKEYIGKENIYEFLKMLNDLVRFSVVSNTDFPFVHYNKIDELPVIEIEFSHLSNYTEQVGKLTLLDTPGPNEAGQEHLKPMLRDQLKKASAILAVLDYTQLKSDADGVVRQELQDIAETCGDRLFVLVNKFDQRDRNADSAEQIQHYVSENLMAGAVAHEAVYPVSASRAYLASRAKMEVKLNQSLDIKQSWVEDFGKIAFGEDWLDDIDDSDSVLKKADGIWKKAGFELPLQHVIQNSYKKAGVLSLIAAASKLDSTARDLENFLELRNTGLRTSTDELNELIKNLNLDIERLTSLAEHTDLKLKRSANDLEQSYIDVFATIKQKVMGDITFYFKEGKAKEKTQAEAKNSKSKPTKGTWGLLSLLGQAKDSTENNDFDPNSPKIQFDNEDDAKELLSKIRRSLDAIVSDSTANQFQLLQTKISDFESYLNNQVKTDCEELLQSIQHNLQSGNFKLDIRMPDIQILSSIDLLSATELGDVKKQSKTVTRQRRKSGAWGTVCSWFDTDDWGWESYQREEKYFEIDIEEVKGHIRNVLNQKLKETSANVSLVIVAPLKLEVKKLFSELSSIIERIRQDLMQSVTDHKKSKVEQEELLSWLVKHSKQAHVIHIDSEGLAEDVNELLGISHSKGGH